MDLSDENHIFEKFRTGAIYIGLAQKPHLQTGNILYIFLFLFFLSLCLLLGKQGRRKVTYG